MGKLRPEVWTLGSLLNLPGVCVWWGGGLCRRWGGVGKLRPRAWTPGPAFSLFCSSTPLGLPLQLCVEGDLKMQLRKGLG